MGSRVETMDLTVLKGVLAVNLSEEGLVGGSLDAVAIEKGRRH